MRIVNMAEDKAAQEFADKARADFVANPHHRTYGDDNPTAGELLAFRWNACCVLVVRLDEGYEPRLFDGPSMKPGVPIPVTP